MTLNSYLFETFDSSPVETRGYNFYGINTGYGFKINDYIYKVKILRLTIDDYIKKETIGLTTAKKLNMEEGQKFFDVSFFIENLKNSKGLDKFKLTGTGNVGKVFVTIISILKNIYNNENVDYFMFSSNKNEKSRIQFYDLLLQRIKKEFPNITFVTRLKKNYKLYVVKVK